MAEEEEQYLSKGSESEYDFYCEFCREDGKMLEAEGYCGDCGEYLCSICYTHHRRSRSSRHHVLLDKDNMPKNRPLSQDRVNKDISKKCGDHSGKPLEYYCREHDILGCSNCIIKSHKVCNAVENIQEAAESILESQELKAFIEILNQFDKRAHSSIKLVQDNLNKSQSWCSEVKKSLQTFREEINSILDDIEKTIITQARKYQKEEGNKLMNISEKVTKSLQSVEKITRELNHLQTSRKVCEIFIKLKESEREVKSIQALLSKAEKENVVIEFAFDPNTKLREFLNDQNGFGTLSVQSPDTAIAMTLPRCNPVNTKATSVTNIGVKSCVDGNVCCLTGSAVVSNNRLIIADHDNSKVKLLDTQSYKMISELTVSSRPWSITVISRNQAAVTLWASHKILLLSVSDSLTVDREILVGGECYGVAYSKNILVVTYTNPGKLEIMDLSGKVMKKVHRDRDGRKMFLCPRYVCASNDGNTIYVSDSGSNEVKCLTFDGLVISVYSDSKLKNPKKLCVDHYGNVYVSGGNSRNVHMLTAGLTEIQIILTHADGLDNHVYSVSHCQDTNRLYVGMIGNKVKVYQQLLS